MNGLVLALLLAVAQSAVVPVSLSQPAYPTIAAAARIAGEVEVVIQVRSDGSIESAKVISGNPLLSEAALKAAKSSRFECRRCTHATTPYSIVFEFQFDDALKEVAPSERPAGTSSQSRVSIVAKTPVVDGIVYANVTRRTRSVKCLWLWTCSFR